MSPKANTPAETAVLESLSEGRVARFTSGDERTIGAAFLRSLAVTRLTDMGLAPLFIAIENAIIDGELQFSGIGSTTAPLPPLALKNCDILGGINLSDSAWTSISLDGCRVANLTASGLRVERSLILNDMTLTSTVQFELNLNDMVVGANFEARNLGRVCTSLCRLSVNQGLVGGSVQLTGAVLSALGDDRPALSMSGLTVKSDLLLDCSDKHRFKTNGAVRIVNANIAGRASFRGAHLDNAGGESLVMDGTQIGGDLLFDEHRTQLDGHRTHRFEAKGAVCLRGVKVQNSLDFSGAKLIGSPDALLLSGAQIGANLILRKSDSNRFEALGAVGLPRAMIGGEVRMQGACLSGDGELFALYMDETTVRGSVFLSSDGKDRFEATGLVDLYGAKFDMNLVLNGASVGRHLTFGDSGEVVDETYRNRRPHNDAKRIFNGMALDLRQVAIHGKALFGLGGKHRFESRGLVCLNGAKIGSELLFEGAYLYNPKGLTLSLDSAQIARDVSLTSSDEHDLQFESRGTISGWGCAIGGALHCNGAILKRRGALALSFDQATIRGQVFLWHSKKFQFVVKGAVLFRHARIDGNFKCDGACFFGRSKVALSLDDTTITGGVFLQSTHHHRFEVYGQLRLARAQIGGDLDLTGARLRNPRLTALYAVDASIGGDVKFCAAHGRRFKSRGELLLSRISIKGRLICQGARMHDEQYNQGYRREERRRALSLYGGVVGDKVTIESCGQYRLEALGLVDLSHTKIGAGVICTAARFENRNATALSLESAKVTGDVYLTNVDKGSSEDPLVESERFEAFGDVDLQAVEINGDLTCDGTFCSPRYGDADKDRGKALTFDNGYVRHRWYVRLSEYSVGEASMRGGRVGTLDDDGGNQWGPKPLMDGEGAEKRLRGIQLKLDGFTYDRFGPWRSPPEPEPGKNRWRWSVRRLFDAGIPQNIWVTRREWLRRQYPGDHPTSEDYFPQPHEQAARALFGMGHHHDARHLLNDRTAHQKQCKADDRLSRLPMSFYRFCFGSGYLPNRALLWTSIYWALGSIFTYIALCQLGGSIVLVKATSGVEIVRAFDNPDAYHRSSSFDPSRDVPKKDGGVIYAPYTRIDTRDIACTSDDIDASLYALDTMLPVLDLHMEEKCEISSDWPVLRFAKAFYAMAGWIMVALAAFTCTGAFRRVPN